MASQNQDEIKRLNLALFSSDIQNTFEYMADRAIKQLIEENAKSWNDYNEISARENADVGSSIAESPLDYLIRTQNSSRHMADIIYRTEEIIAFFEMKIIYAFKHLEINIKRLIKLAYPEFSINQLFQWKRLLDFLDSKSIDATLLDGYEDVDQLRKINNISKHSMALGQLMPGIPEFSGEGGIQHLSLEKFYQRVKPAPDKFLQALNAAIYAKLYPPRRTQ